jgi:hypothetical protein
MISATTIIAWLITTEACIAKEWASRLRCEAKAASSASPSQRRCSMASAVVALMA